MESRLRLSELLAAATDEVDPWDVYSRRANRRAIASLRREWSAIQGNLEWTFDGNGVYDHAITFVRLTDLCSALGQTLRWTARDLAILEGRPVTTDFRALVEPVVTGTFAGSFGLRVAAPPVVEQLEFVPGGTLFERTADRVLGVFRASSSDDAGPAIVNLLSGLRLNAVNGFKNLSSHLVDAGAPSSIRWRDETVWTVTMADAAELLATLSEVQPTEEEIPVTGVLVGGDSDTGQFHIVQRRSTGDLHYRGKTDEGVDRELEGLTLGTLVSAVVLVVRLESRFTEEPRETYLLRQIAPAVSGG